MSYLLKRKRFPESVTQFYAASVLVAFEELHLRLIAYRDLKVSSNMGYCFFSSLLLLIQQFLVLSPKMLYWTRMDLVFYVILVLLKRLMTATLIPFAGKLLEFKKYASHLVLM